MDFSQELRDKIFPFLSRFQPGFIIHGPGHLARCLIYANALCELEWIHDRQAVFYAIAFHDSGRQFDHGIDHNDAASVERLKEYLATENKMYLSYPASSYILKEAHGAIEQDIVYDTDVLDIMRDSCGVGVYQFNREYLRLLKYKYYADAFISECIRLMRLTDNIPRFNGVDALDKMNELIKEQNFNLLKCLS